MHRRVASALSVLLLAVGGVQGGRGAWIYAKAEIAQVLLRRSWAATMAGRERVRPWPWADAWPVGRIILPDGDAIVLAGASGRTLAFAPGHLDGTAPPGAPGTCVIAGHRDTHFAVLEDLVEGDPVRLEDPSGTVHTYRVTATAVVDESETAVLAASALPTLVLITCWPFDAVNPGGPLRYVVWAESVARSNVERLNVRLIRNSMRWARFELEFRTPAISAGDRGGDS
jgi:sortase A